MNGEELWGENSWGRWAPNAEDPDRDRPMEFFLGLEFDTVSTQGDEFDYESAILTAGVLMPMPYGIDFSMHGLYEWQDYRNGSLIDRQRRAREDFLQEYSFRLERRFFLTPDHRRDYEYASPLQPDRSVMTVFGGLRFTINDSNVRDRLGQSIFEYNRVIYSAGVRFDIN